MGIRESEIEEIKNCVAEKNDRKKTIGSLIMKKWSKILIIRFF